MRKYIILAIIGILFISGSMAIEQQQKTIPKSNIPVCTPSNGNFRCNSRVIVDEHGKPFISSTPSGYGPSQFLVGYNLSNQTSTTQTIAIVDAFDDPNIVNDLTIYSKTFGLPVLKTCPVSQGTSSSPCFQKVNQNGLSNPLPRTNSGWALEISLDVEIAHAICQNCNILLIEANSNSYSNLMAAVDRAVIMGANVISNSYGGSEFSSETSLDYHFNHPGIAITFSSGDNGYGTQYPAASQFVTAVGGTTLNLNPDNSYNSELVWSGSGSGCSGYEPQPSFQNGLVPSSICSKRIIADVSADADPNTGAAVYDTVKYFGQSGWFQVGGTSLSSPLIAGTYATAGGIGSNQGNSVPYSLYNYANNLHDITTGSNGGCGNLLCNANTSYDGPTGLGTPNTNGAFS